MMKKIIGICLLVAGSVFAEEKPHFFQASVTPNIAIHERDARVEGIALSIWGENPQTAFAFGLVNGSTGDSGGFSWGLCNYADNYTGVMWGVVNYVSGEFVGWQDGFINYTDTMKGVQTGVFNYAGSLSGVQIGLVNYVQTAGPCLQLGLVNIISDNEWFSNFPDELARGMVFLNWSFE